MFKEGEVLVKVPALNDVRALSKGEVEVSVVVKVLNGVRFTSSSSIERS